MSEVSQMTHDDHHRALVRRLGAVGPMEIASPSGGCVRIGLRCAYSTGMRAARPLIPLWWMVRRGASMSARLSGLLVGAAASFFSFATLRLECPIDEPLHIL